MRPEVALAKETASTASAMSDARREHDPRCALDTCDSVGQDQAPVRGGWLWAESEKAECG